MKTNFAIFWLGYGMTELSPVSHATPCDDNIKYGSIGILLSNLECKVSNAITICNLAMMMSTMKKMTMINIMMNNKSKANEC